MSAMSFSLFKTLVSELKHFDQNEHRVFKGTTPALNGIIRVSPTGAYGVIIHGKIIYRININKEDKITVTIYRSEHVIVINTENSMRIFTAGCVLADFPIVKTVSGYAKDTPLWAKTMNELF